MWPLTIGFVYRIAIVDVTANPDYKRVGRQYSKVICRLALFWEQSNKLTCLMANWGAFNNILLVSLYFFKIQVGEKICENTYNVIEKLKIVVLVYVSNGLLTSQFLMARVPSKNQGSKM